MILLTQRCRNKTKTFLLFISMLVLVTVPALAEETVLWDLAKHEIPAELQSGAIEKVDGKIALRDGAAFAVPAEAFPDQKTFTVQVTASLYELVENGVFTAMTKQGDQDDGFTFSMNHRAEPWYARHVAAIVNNIFMSARAINGQRGPQVDTPYTSTVAVRDGFASFYIDDVPDKVSDEVVYNRMRDLAQCMKAGAPQAKIYHLMTTPHTVPRPAPGEPVDSLGEKNDVVVRLNTISAQVMKEEDIEIIDIYAILARQLELASGDGYHWQPPAYQIISQEIAKRVLPVLGK